jgi:aminoglycoside phosphotransferase (APT) family kinase protein
MTEQLTSEVLDQAVAVRTGEDLELSAIDRYLKSNIGQLEGEPKVKQFPGGASNLTYLVQYENRDLILRRPPFGTVAKSAHDMVREAKVIQSLQPVYPYVPEILAICEDHSVIGCDFYVMSRFVGIIPRQDLPKGLSLTEQDTRKLCTNVIDKLIDLHSINPEQAGLGAIGKGDGYVARQISGWSDRYRKAMTDNATGFETVMVWLDEKQPKDIANRIIHNDFRFDNVVLNPDNPFEVIGVLDWEMATLGDPLMDLGNSLAYWIEANDEPQMQFMRRQPTHLKGMLTRQQVVDYYMERTGFEVPCFDFYEIYGLFRLAVIIQQIYYRFHHGQTKDKRFENFIHAANYLEQRCMKLIERSSL